jgi:GMP reductase
MRIISEPKYNFSDVLIVPQRTFSASRKDINLSRKFVDKSSGKYWGTYNPIIAANMDVTGTFLMAKTLAKYDCMTALHKHYSVDQLVNYFNDPETPEYNVFYSLGIRNDDVEKLKKVLSLTSNIKNICVHVANGYSNVFIDTVKRIKDLKPDAVLMAGNIVTPNIAEELVLNAGVDIIKCGIGSGAACTTRIMTGVGFPQLSAVIECADAAHGLNKFVCSDGGCKVAGDVAKAFGGGADFVMLGGMLAGHDECDGEVIEKQYSTNDVTNWGKPLIETKKFMKFRGMSSKEAQIKHSGKMETYKASEGKEVLIPYKGSVENTIQEILGGLRSTCTYVGAKSLKDLPKCTTFVLSSEQENKVFS